jgi:hypothetical protein
MPKIANRSYMPPAGSFSNYEQDISEVVRLFELKKRGFPWKADEALSVFLESKRREGDQLVSVSSPFHTFLSPLLRELI